MTTGKHQILLRRYNDRDREKWNGFIPLAKNGLFQFDRAYMDYHKDRFTDHSLIAERNGKIVALFPANESRQAIFSHEGLTYGGLLLDKRMGVEEVMEVFEKMLDYYRRTGFRSITYKVIPYILHTSPASEDQYALFHHEATLTRRDISSVIDLAAPVTTSATNRRKAAQCAKKGVRVSENPDFSEYWELLSAVLWSRYQVLPVHTLEEIMHLKSRFPDKIRLFEARNGATLLAGVVIYDYGKVIHTQYMANSEEGRELRALDFINAVLINDVYNQRQFYSFGPSAGDADSFLNEGLLRYKEMMGGRAVSKDVYTINLIDNRIRTNIHEFKPSSMTGKEAFIHPQAEVQTAEIGEGTVIWQFSIVLKGAVIGSNCNINCHTFIEGDVVIGNNVTVKAGVYLWNGLRVGDDVFIGPNASFTNDKFPRSKRFPDSFQKIVLEKGCSIGAAAVILGDVVIGEYAVIAAGSVVTKSVPAHAMVKGSPAVIFGWVDDEGMKLTSASEGKWIDKTGKTYEIINNKLEQR